MEFQRSLRTRKQQVSPSKNGIAGFDTGTQLTTTLYATLERLAQSKLRAERGNHTLDVSDLVHEACARLIERDATIENRSHFLALGALTLRQVLVDHERRRRTRKRDAGVAVSFSITRHDEGVETTWDLPAFLELIERLAQQHQRPARVVELRFLGGLGDSEIATHLGVSERTVSTDWRFARAWLRHELGDTGSKGNS